MECTEFSRFTVEISDKEKITVEFLGTDVTVSDVCKAFRTIMVGLTFTDETAGEIIASYLEEYYGNRYNVINIDE